MLKHIKYKIIFCLFHWRFFKSSKSTCICLVAIIIMIITRLRAAQQDLPYVRTSLFHPVFHLYLFIGCIVLLEILDILLFSALTCTEFNVITLRLYYYCQLNHLNAAHLLTIQKLCAHVCAFLCMFIMILSWYRRGTTGPQ